MRVFANKRVVPPGGRYFYEVPETKAYIDSPTRGGLVSVVRRHYEANGIPPPQEIEDLIEDFMCRRLPRGFCRGGEPEVKTVTLRAIREATLALFRMAGGTTIPLEARRRAAVCGRCDRNDRTLCPTCIGLVAWGLSVVRQPTSGFEAWLGVCTVDRTALSAKVYMKSVAGDYPEHCWATDHGGQQ